MKYVLDTTAVSALMAGRPAAVQQLGAIGADQVLVPQPVLAELEYGIERLSASRRKDQLRRRLDYVISGLARGEWTDDVSAAFGQIKARLEKLGKRLDDFDIAVAAHAVALGAVLITANARHMGRIEGLTIADWQ